MIERPAMLFYVQQIPIALSKMNDYASAKQLYCINRYNKYKSIKFSKFKLMNRVVFHIIQENTSVKYQQLQLLHSPKPNQIAFQSQNFPIYPITINMYLQNPPFNKLALAFVKDFCPNRIIIYASENGLKYVKIKYLKNLIDRQQQIINIFEDKIFFGYIKLSIQEPQKTKANLCKQIKMKGIQLSMVSFYQCRFVCSLRAKITYHPVLFRLLEVLEYKCLILKKDSNKIYQKYQKRLDSVVKMIDNRQIDISYPSQEVITKWSEQIGYLQSQPIHYDNFVQLPDPVKTKKDINKLQKELQSFSVDRLGHIKPQVQHYFHKYIDKEIKQSYCRQLSSHQRQDHNKALVNFWNQIKKLPSFTPEMQEAVLMFLNFYLQFTDLPLKVSALKVLILFNKINQNPKNESLYPTYDRILNNIIRFLHLKEDEQFYQLSLKYCYLLYDRIDNSLFINQLLNAFRDYSLTEKLQKLEILEKITFRGVQIVDKREVVDFLVDLLLQKEISLTEKNRAYNVAAYLASLYGKQVIMKDFQKLNTMITMSMQKNIDLKLGKIKKSAAQDNEQSDVSCEFCGLKSSKFKDQNLYDLHKAKECKYITNCRLCSQNVEIPQLFKHYIEKCAHKHEFKHCENCFEVIQLKDEQNHNKICTRKLQTKCPLCYEKLSSKLKLKEHLLVQGCPNNSK